MRTQAALFDAFDAIDLGHLWGQRSQLGCNRTQIEEMVVGVVGAMDGDGEEALALALMGAKEERLRALGVAAARAGDGGLPPLELAGAATARRRLDGVLLLGARSPCRGMRPSRRVVLHV